MNADDAVVVYAAIVVVMVAAVMPITSTTTRMPAEPEENRRTHRAAVVQSDGGGLFGGSRFQSGVATLPESRLAIVGSTPTMSSCPFHTPPSHKLRTCNALHRSTYADREVPEAAGSGGSP